MRINRKDIIRTAFASMLLLGMSVAQFAVAENPNSSDDLDVQVELAKGLTLQCTTLDFGVIIVPLGDRGGFNTVYVNPGIEGVHTPSMFVANGDITLTPTAQRAICQISGYRADTANVQITATPLVPSGGVILGAAPSDGPSDIINLNDGSQSEDGLFASLYINAPLADPPVPSIVWTSTDEVFNGTTPDGSSALDFFVGGAVLIPNNLVADNMGKYVGTVTITIQDGDDS